MATKKATEAKTTKAEPKVAAKKTAAVKATAPKAVAKKATGKFEVTAFDLSGKEAGSLSLPEQIFGAKVSNALLKQAVRVYNTNRQAHHGHTKTRGEVQGSTRKIFRQKGTGNARHGSVMAPIFVGGGIALGPRARRVELDLPKKMKTAALISALSQKHAHAEVVGLAGLEKASGKTKDMAVFARGTGSVARGKLLLVLGETNEKVVRAAQNLASVNTVLASQLNVFDVIGHGSILLTKDAVENLAKRVKGEKQVS